MFSFVKLLIFLVCGFHLSALLRNKSNYDRRWEENYASAATSRPAVASANIVNEPYSQNYSKPASPANYYDGLSLPGHAQDKVISHVKLDLIANVQVFFPSQYEILASFLKLGEFNEDTCDKIQNILNQLTQVGRWPLSIHHVLMQIFHFVFFSNHLLFRDVLFQTLNDVFRNAFYFQSSYNQISYQRGLQYFQDNLSNIMRGVESRPAVYGLDSQVVTTFSTLMTTNCFFCSQKHCFCAKQGKFPSVYPFVPIFGAFPENKARPLALVEDPISKHFYALFLYHYQKSQRIRCFAIGKDTPLPYVISAYSANSQNSTNAFYLKQNGIFEGTIPVSFYESLDEINLDSVSNIMTLFDKVGLGLFSISSLIFFSLYIAQWDQLTCYNCDSAVVRFLGGFSHAFFGFFVGALIYSIYLSKREFENSINWSYLLFSKTYTVREKMSFYYKYKFFAPKKTSFVNFVRGNRSNSDVSISPLFVGTASTLSLLGLFIPFIWYVNHWAKKNYNRTHDDLDGLFLGLSVLVGGAFAGAVYKHIFSKKDDSNLQLYDSTFGGA